MTPAEPAPAVERAAAPPAAGALARGPWARGLALAGLVALACVPPFVLSGFRLFQLTQVAISAVALLGLNILTGYSGQISLGHGAFFALGAYTAAILTDRFGVAYGWTLPAAGALCLVTGVLFGLPALRLEGLYLALATFALALAVPQILKYFERWTGGSQGIVLVKPEAPAGLPLTADQWLYFLALAVLLVLFTLARNLLRGRPGRALVALRDHPIAAQAMGINAPRYKALAFGVSAAYTGVAGALSALVVAFVAPDAFTVFLSITFLVGVVVGGLASIAGAVYGAVFIQFVPIWAQEISKAAPWAIYGVFLIACMYVMPRGIAGFVRLAAARVRHLAARSAREEAPMPTTRLLALALALALAAPATVLAADPGVTAAEIKIGHTNPYSGPASAYGTIGKALAAYFRKVNDEGGVNGRKITFITYDDGYSPPRTVEMVRKLVEQDQVLLIFQPLGTPSNTAIQKYLNQKQVPQLFVATGATKWGDPKNFPWTMGWQPSYQTEARIYANYVLRAVPNPRIGILYQNDDYGKDYLKGFKDGLGEAARKLIVLEQTYEVTDPTVDSQIVNLKNSGANVFFNITTPKFAAQAIRKAHDIGWKPVHLLNSVSASPGAVLRPAGLEASRDLITAQYLKEPDDPQWKDDPGMNDWRAFMRKYYPEGNLSDTFNVYAYAVGQTLVHVLRQCGNDLTRANVMRQAANLRDLVIPQLLPGIKINTSPTDYYPIEQMQLARFDGERWVRFGELFDAAALR